jgi:hypothetical protein
MRIQNILYPSREKFSGFILAANKKMSQEES